MEREATRVTRITGNIRVSRKVPHLLFFSGLEDGEGANGTSKA